jgi:prepilin-type N-terminal cleavage/methylation domain-containing protein
MTGNRGFTLIEILLTLTVLTVLLMIGIPQFTDFSVDARKAVTRDRLSAIREAIVGDPRLVSGGVYTKPGYIGNCLKVPDTLTYLAAKPADSGVEPTCVNDYDPVTRLGWNGPYLDTTPSDWNKDAWGTAIVYSSAGRTLTSWGPDLGSGGGDDISLSF